jgi:cyclophilin family peptidyl-prolyl cis-trans isomerase
MIQGGKAKDGDDDESLWGGAFTDEFDDRLKHIGVGVLSMANSGTNTNRQQFFMTFKSCNHLDRKHSIFGNVIDGTDLLTTMEKVPADKKERPIEPIRIIGFLSIRSKKPKIWTKASRPSRTRKKKKTFGGYHSTKGKGRDGFDQK